MFISSPLHLLWLLPLLSLIALMYVLKLRRQDVVVPSTFLWRQVVRDMQANAPFQKLRKNLLLLLQLLIAALIVLALARPFLRVPAMGGRSIVLLVDVSATMQATDVWPSRLEAAKQRARDRVAALHPGDKTMLLSAGARPEALTGFTDERAELYRALDTLKPTAAAAKMREAVTLAADLIAARKTPGRIELVSDGCFLNQGTKAEASLDGLNLGAAHIAFYPVGRRRENVGITAVDFRRAPGSATTGQLLVATRNVGAQSRTFTEEIYADDNLVEAHEVTLAPGGEDTQPYDLPEPEAPIRLRVRLDVRDDLSLDNEAVLVIRPRRMLRALLVGKPNLFLENAIRVAPDVELSRTDAFASGKGFDVVVFEEQAPPKLPEGNYLFLHCASDRAPVRLEGAANDVGTIDSDHEHPAMRYVDFGVERFKSVLRALPLDWGQELAVGDSGSLVVAGEKGHTRSLFAAFSLRDSDFPFRVAFPIFIADSLRWLGSDDESERQSVDAGSPILLPAPARAVELTVTKPDGARRVIPVRDEGGAVFEETDQVGFYTASGPGVSTIFAADVSGAAVTDITPRAALNLADNPPDSAGHPLAESRELLSWAAALALLFLGVEWWVYHRRVGS